MRVHFQ
ncbi:hypothetical protein D034_4822A, partial [Vibrio parahaemolyticus Peru-288]